MVDPQRLMLLIGGILCIAVGIFVVAGSIVLIRREREHPTFPVYLTPTQQLPGRRWVYTLMGIGTVLLGGAMLYKLFDMASLG